MQADPAAVHGTLQVYRFTSGSACGRRTSALDCADRQWGSDMGRGKGRRTRGQSFLGIFARRAAALVRDAVDAADVLVFRVAVRLRHARDPLRDRVLVLHRYPQNDDVVEAHIRGVQIRPRPKWDLVNEDGGKRTWCWWEAATV